jgi:multiple sugar transport system permease protein
LQSGRIDGCSELRLWWEVALPIIRPMIGAFTLLTFMGSWNSFLWPLVVLRSPELQTLPIALAGLQGQYTSQWDVIMAGSVISVLPMLALYIFAQKYVIQGVASSGIK